jgi:hypothetical protein
MRLPWLIAAPVAGVCLVACAEPGRARPDFAGAAGTTAGEVLGDGGPVIDAPRPGSPPPVDVDVDGVWLLYGWEDPVAVRITLRARTGQAGFDVIGRGCFDGPAGLLGDPSCEAPHPDSCGPVSGSAEGSALQFAIHFEASNFVYAADVHASADGTRMAGAFLTGKASNPSLVSRALGWVRLDQVGGSCRQWMFPPADFAPVDWRALGPIRPFVLQGTDALGWLEPGQPYSLRTSKSGIVSITGDLGVFWNPDFHWDDNERWLTAGPVPATVPGMPILLRLHFDEHLDLNQIVAVTPDGARDTLLPVP